MVFMEEKERLSREEIIALYQDDAMKLLKYYPWAKKVSGNNLQQLYTGEGIEKTSMCVPVYDSTLLQFVQTAKTTQFMNRNYVYTYSRYSIRKPEDEIKLIKECTLQDIKIIGDILSSYCYRGDVKGAVWTQGVEEGVFVALLEKIKELLSIRQPLA